ncbi:hypothetical protein X801_07423, partial [Opisthorchis viverrini]
CIYFWKDATAATLVGGRRTNLRNPVVLSEASMHGKKVKIKISDFSSIQDSSRRLSKSLPSPSPLPFAGRNFPERPDYHLVCEARFNNEVLSTDPMPHTVQPVFEQELAWELDRSRLKQHRLHRTVLKIQLYAVHTSTPVKEAVGMFMLDLRSCSFNKEYKWFRLLHCKYKGPPEVFCGIYLDTNEGAVVPDQVVKSGKSVRALSIHYAAVARNSGFGTSLSAADLTPRVLSLREDFEQTPNSDLTSQRVWHVIGPKALSKKSFLLTLKFGEVSNNLASLIPITKDLSSESHSGFYFSCDILGTSVATRRFDSLVQTNLSSEEHQFFIRSTVDVLRAYFQHINPIPVKLFYGTRCLARALVASDRFLASADSTLQSALILEGHFQLRERVAATPLVVEVFVRSEEPQGSDSLLGRSTIQLGAIFNCPVH